MSEQPFCTINWDAVADVMKLANAPPELVERWPLSEGACTVRFLDTDGVTLLEAEAVGRVERMTVGATQGYKFTLLSSGEPKELKRCPITGQLF